MTSLHVTADVKKKSPSARKEKKRLHLSALNEREAWYYTRLPSTISYSTSTVIIQTAEHNATAICAQSITQSNDMQADIN